LICLAFLDEQKRLFKPMAEEIKNLLILVVCCLMCMLFESVAVVVCCLFFLLFCTDENQSKQLQNKNRNNRLPQSTSKIKQKQY